jgi:hypothetical protein
MASADRSDITNAIWLCGNCHKLVDDDPGRYPAGLLFEWQREHEKRMAEQVGKAGAEIRHRYEIRHLEEFGRLSYLAERLLLEKGDLWEYRLTSELLRYEMAPELRRWDALRRGLYMKPTVRVAVREFGHWLADRISEALKITSAFEELMNQEFHRAWGEPGVAGDDSQIISTCRSCAEMCSSALAWEEQVRFAKTHNAFDDVLYLLRGVMGGVIDQAARVPKFMAETFDGKPESGTYFLNLTLVLPEDWHDRVGGAMQRAEAEIIEGIQSGAISF